MTCSLTHLLRFSPAIKGQDSSAMASPDLATPSSDTQPPPKRPSTAPAANSQVRCTCGVESPQSPSASDKGTQANFDWRKPKQQKNLETDSWYSLEHLFKEEGRQSRQTQTATPGKYVFNKKGELVESKMLHQGNEVISGERVQDDVTDHRDPDFDPEVNCSCLYKHASM